MTAAGQSSVPHGAADDASDESGFLPKASQLSAQAFADGKNAVHNATSFVRSVHTISTEAQSSLKGTMQDRPYLVLGAAATAGFVLGRGLSFGMSRTLLGIGGKFAMSMLIKRVTQGALSSI
jgi:ElaB/YqjD/DUF883 family membrane-anchored ribosome-binding protein